MTKEGNVDITELDKVRDVRKTEQGLSFLYGGDINVLLRVLSEQNLQDLAISEPNLEEIFMHYYENGGAKA